MDESERPSAADCWFIVGNRLQHLRVGETTPLSCKSPRNDQNYDALKELFQLVGGPGTREGSREVMSRIPTKQADFVSYCSARNEGSCSCCAVGSSRRVFITGRRPDRRHGDDRSDVVVIHHTELISSRRNGDSNCAGRGANKVLTRG